MMMRIIVWENSKGMDVIESVMKKVERLRKSEIIKISERLELNVQKIMRKDELVRK